MYKECNELVEGRPAILKPSKILRSCSVIGFCLIKTNSGSILRSYVGFMDDFPLSYLENESLPQIGYDLNSMNQAL